MTQAALRRPPIDENPPSLRVIPGYGGGPPADWSTPAIPSAQLAIIVLIVFESMLFAGLLGAYMVYRVNNIAWPPPNLPHLPIALTLANTTVLLASAYTMRRAVVALRGGARTSFMRYLMLTAALGSLFLGIQGSEWVQLIAQGLTLSVHVYGAIFYTIIGFHALHVVVAVLWLLTLLALAWRGIFNADYRMPVEVCATYWYFVSGLWVLLFGMIYLY